MDAGPTPPTPEDPLREIFGEPIYSYSRAQALADGVLVDVTPWAKGLFKIPVAFTSALWAMVESIPEKLAKTETPESRTRAILRAAIEAARRLERSSDRVAFPALLVVRQGLKTLDLVAVCGPGDTPEPVLTIGFPVDF